MSLQITVQGDEVGKFNKAFTYFVSYIFAFLFCVALQIFFLRKYHEGEVSVGTAAVIFFVIWLALAAETFLKIRMFANIASIGEMAFNTVGLAITILLALGIEKGEIFDQAIKEEQMNLEKGDVIVFYTDGFTEAMNKNLEEYGERRLCDIILRGKDKPAQHIMKDIIADVNQFAGGYPQHDDMTMVIVKVF